MHKILGSVTSGLYLRCPRILEELQDYATRWLWIYNHERPNMALGGITPKQKLALAA